MLVGAAAGLKVRLVPRAVATGAITHLLLDAIPHRDYRRGAAGGVVLAIDLSAGAVMTWSLSEGSWPALAGALGGLLPDALRAGEKRAGISLTTLAHDLSHAPYRPSKGRAVAIQAVIMLVGGVLLRRIPRRSQPVDSPRRGIRIADARRRQSSIILLSRDRSRT